MLLSSKNDELDGNKTFEVYSSYFMVAGNILKQTNRQLISALYYGLHRRKSVTFRNEGTFSLTSSLQEVHVVF